MKAIFAKFLALSIFVLTSSLLMANEPLITEKNKTESSHEKPEKKDTIKEEKSEKNLEYMYAITETGERIIIFSDGTWEFAPNETEAKPVARKVNPEKFKKPEKATDVLKGNVVDYQVNYDKTKWAKLEKPLNENAEFSLIHSEKNAYVIIIPEKIKIPIENLRNIVYSNARNASKNAKIVEEEERTVNNSRVVMLRINADIEGLNFVYLYYIYSGENASIQIIGFTTEELFDEYKTDIENLLNGFDTVQDAKK